MTDAPEQRPRLAREARALFELFAVCGLAITQPLLDLFGRAVEQFALRGASAAQIVVFALGVTTLPALGLWMAELVSSLAGARARRAVHVGLLGGLTVVGLVQAARPIVTGPPLFVLGLGVGGLAIVGYLRVAAVRLWLSFAAVAPIGFLALFLVASPTADLLHDRARPAPVEVAAPAPVVMLVLDELPLESLVDADGALQAGLFPNLAALAADSHWFRNTTTVAPATWHAVPAILTGRVPEAGTSPVAGDHPENLFTLLGGTYEMQVTETISRMCPASICEPRAQSGGVWRGLAGDALRVMRSRLSLHRRADDPVSGFASLEDVNPDEGEKVFGDLDVSQPDRFRNLIDGLDDDPRSLHYLHILLPHVPWRYLPSGVTYNTSSPDIGRSSIVLDTWADKVWPTTLARQRHLLQLAYVDDLIGVLVDELRAREMYDDALIVVTADHGISFEQGAPIRSIEGQPLTAASIPDVLWVPLFVKEPGQTTGEVSDANVLSIDVLPTIADVLGVELPWAVDGRSALGPPRSSTDKPFYGSDVERGAVRVLPVVTVDGPAGWARVLERSIEGFVPSGAARDDLWRIGPSPDLVGQAVDEVLERLEAVDAELLSPDLYDDVQGGGVLPLLVRGHIAGEASNTPIAVAVNGVVAATGLTYGDLGGAAFALLIEDHRLHPGRNDVQLYRIR